MITYVTIFLFQGDLRWAVSGLTYREKLEEEPVKVVYCHLLLDYLLISFKVFSRITKKVASLYFNGVTLLQMSLL
jgi:hypothetical protein